MAALWERTAGGLHDGRSAAGGLQRNLCHSPHPRRRLPSPLSCHRRRLRAGAAAAADGDAAGGGGALQREWRRQTIARMKRFVGPALVIPLGDPLQSVIDTVCIGQFAGTGELAAMAPALVIFAFCQYSVQALQIATITLVGDALSVDDREHAARMLAAAMWVAGALGLATAVVLEAMPEQLIALTGADPALVALGAGYMRIRALAQPAVLLSMVCQAGLLAQQESRAPAVSVLLALAISLAGNLVAVAWLGLGLAGAAATTVAAQVAQAAVLWRAVAAVGAAGGVHPDTRSPPAWPDLARLAATCGPLSVTSLCKNLAYIAIQGTAAGLEVVRLAAHQAVFSVFNLFAFASSPIEQAALAFVPRAKTGQQRRETIRLVLWMGIIMGVSCGAVTAALVAGAPQLLTRDAAVWAHMASLGPQALASMVLVGVDVSVTSVLLALGDYAYVARSFLFTLCALVGFLWLAGGGGAVGGLAIGAGAAAALQAAAGDRLALVWWALCFFFAVRTLQSVVRLASMMWEGQRSSSGAALAAD